jgi:predicted RNA-binding Zn-ribbon protein involved in translation (DUF1610 family)
MKEIEAASTENDRNEPAKEKPTDNSEKNTASTHPGILAQQCTVADGGMATDMYCPACREEIFGTYLPIFECPHCAIKIWRDDKGNVTSYEQKHTCPECGHTFGAWSEDAPNDFCRVVRNFEQKAEGVFLGIDRMVNRIFA